MKNYRAAVIGSGFGGLAAAIRLQTMGYQTTIFEKRDLPGGRAYVYRDEGFTFDAGPTVVTAPHCLEELFTGAGRKLESYVDLMPVKPFYRLLWEDGYSFDYSNDEAEFRAQIARKSPADVDGYDKFLKYSEAVFRAGYEELVAEPFLDIWSMVKVAPELIKLKAYRSVYSMVAQYVKDPHLREAFSFHSLLVGGNPFRASAIYTLIHFLEKNWGVTFPRGGTGALVQALVKLFEELGGKIELNSEVAEIQTKDNKITGLELKSGRRERFDLVVSNADVVHTYKKLLHREPKVAAKARRLEKKPHSMSLFLIYFGTKEKYPNIAHHSILFGKRYKELLTDIFDRGNLPDDFSLYLHRPTASDSSLAPEGCESFYVLSPVSHLGKNPIDWREEGPRYAEKIMKYLEHFYMPDLRKNLVVQRIFTPLDFSQELNAHWGSAFSLEPTLLQSAYFRVHNRDEVLSNLYFVGAGTHPGAGIPGVINSAKATAKVIAQDFPFVNAPITKKLRESAVPSGRNEAELRA